MLGERTIRIYCTDSYFNCSQKIVDFYYLVCESVRKNMINAVEEVVIAYGYSDNSIHSVKNLPNVIVIIQRSTLLKKSRTFSEI